MKIIFKNNDIVSLKLVSYSLPEPKCNISSLNNNFIHVIKEEGIEIIKELFYLKVDIQ